MRHMLPSRPLPLPAVTGLTKSNTITTLKVGCRDGTLRARHTRRARYARDIIESAFRIRLVEIQRWRNDAFSHRKKNCTDSGATTGALWMADHRLSCAHWNAPRAFLKAMPNRASFNAVIQDG